MENTEMLKRLFSNQTIKIRALNGEENTISSKDFFINLVSGCGKVNFKKNKKTPETEIEVYDVLQNARFSRMFEAFNQPLDDLCLTPKQIVEVCVNKKEYLSADQGSFFLIKKRKWFFRDKFLVVNMRLCFNQILVSVFPLDHRAIYSRQFHYRIVVPLGPAS